MLNNRTQICRFRHRQLAWIANAITAVAIAALRLSARPAIGISRADRTPPRNPPEAPAARCRSAGSRVGGIRRRGNPAALRLVPTSWPSPERNHAKKSGQRATAMSCVNTAPIDARTASTEKGSAQSSIRISPPAPAASPVLRIVPNCLDRAAPAPDPERRHRRSILQRGRRAADKRQAALRMSLPLNLLEDVSGRFDRFAARLFRRRGSRPRVGVSRSRLKKRRAAATDRPRHAPQVDVLKPFAGTSPSARRVFL